jgi:ribosomal protein S18 acetylase RimI-like enzyme
MPTLRPACESDLAVLVQLSGTLADHDIALGQRRPVRSSADPTAAIAKALADPSQHHVAVIVDEDGDVIGMCRTALMGDEHPCAAHIHDIIVDEPYRSQGLGQALLDDAITWCEKRGIDEVCLGVAPLSTRSRRFYELYGFEETSILLVRTVRQDLAGPAPEER